MLSGGLGWVWCEVLSWVILVISLSGVLSALEVSLDGWAFTGLCIV